jgi:hypothetical protein
MGDVAAKVKREAQRSALMAIGVGILLLIAGPVLFRIGTGGFGPEMNAFDFRGAVVFVGLAVAAMIAGAALLVMSPIRYTLRMRSVGKPEKSEMDDSAEQA